MRAHTFTRDTNTHTHIHSLSLHTPPLSLSLTNTYAHTLIPPADTYTCLLQVEVSAPHEASNKVEGEKAEEEEELSRMSWQEKTQNTTKDTATLQGQGPPTEARVRPFHAAMRDDNTPVTSDREEGKQRPGRPG